MTPSDPITSSETASSLAEVVFALALVAFSFGALFSIFSSSFPLLRGQQDTIAANLGLQERLDGLRATSWAALTDGDRLRNELTASPLRSVANLSSFGEEIKVSVYPPPSTESIPLLVRRGANGAEILSESSSASLKSSPLVRVDVQLSWQAGGKKRTREASAVMAYGGIAK